MVVLLMYCIPSFLRLLNAGICLCPVAASTQKATNGNQGLFNAGAGKRREVRGLWGGEWKAWFAVFFLGEFVGRVT